MCLTDQEQCLIGEISFMCHFHMKNHECDTISSHFRDRKAPEIVG